MSQSRRIPISMITTVTVTQTEVSTEYPRNLREDNFYFKNLLAIWVARFLFSRDIFMTRGYFDGHHYLSTFNFLPHKALMGVGGPIILA